MAIEWDENKRVSNLAKHLLDFQDADLLFDGRKVVSGRSPHPTETRFMTTGVLNDLFVTVVWTWRLPKRRIISMRRARDAEKRAYRELYDG